MMMLKNLTLKLTKLLQNKSQTMMQNGDIFGEWDN
jgi:hypothetical protein